MGWGLGISVFVSCVGLVVVLSVWRELLMIAWMSTPVCVG